MERDELQHVSYAQRISLAQSELENNYSTHAEQLLAATAPALRNWEYRFLRQESRRQLWDFGPFDMPLMGVTISHDQRKLAACSGIWGTNQPGEIRIWDLNSGALLHVLRGHPSSVYDVQFSPDDRLLVSTGIIWRAARGTGGKVIAWDVATGAPLQEVMSESGTKACFSPDGQFLAIGAVNFQVQIFRVADWQLAKSLRGHRGLVFDLGYDDTGTRLVTGSRDGSCRVWNLDNEQAEIVNSNLVDVRSVDFSPNGTDLAVATFQGIVKTYRRRTGRYEELASFQPRRRVNLVRYTPDGLYLAAATVGDGTKLIDPDTGAVVRQFPGHNGDVVSLACSADGHLLASAGFDGHVRVWNTIGEEQPLTSYRVAPFLVDAVRIPETKQIVFAQGLNTTRGVNYTDRSAIVWDGETRQIVRSFQGHRGWLSSVAFDPIHRRLASGSEDKTICLWDFASGQLLRQIEASESPVVDVAFADKGNRIIAADAQSHVRIFASETGQEQMVWQFPGEALLFCQEVPQHKAILVASREGTLRLLRAGNDQPLAITQANSPIQCVSLSPDGRLIAVGRHDHSIQLIDVEQWIARQSTWASHLIGHTDTISSLGFSDDSLRLASVGEDGVKIWDIASQQILLRFIVQGIRQESLVSFDSSQNQLCIGFGAAIAIWQVDAESTNSLDAAQQRDHAGPLDHQLEAWHRRELATAAAKENWYAALQHAGWLLLRFPDDARLLQTRGGAEANLGHWDAAYADWSHVPSQFQDSSYWYQSAVLALVRQDSAGFRAAQQKLLEGLKQPGNLGAVNTAIWVWSLAAGSPPVLADQDFASLIRSNNGDYLNTVAAAYYRLGKYDESLGLLQRSLALHDPDSAPFDWLFLALNLAAQGKDADAAGYAEKFDHWWQRQLDLEQFNRPMDPLLTWATKIEMERLRDELRQSLAVFPTAG